MQIVIAISTCDTKLRGATKIVEERSTEVVMFKAKERSPSQAAKSQAVKASERHEEYRGSLAGFRSGGRRGRSAPTKGKDSFVRGYN